MNPSKDEFIASRIYRRPIYRTFLYIEEYIVSSLPYRVSWYSQYQWFFCLLSSKILRKFRKFAENSENPWTKVLNNNNNNNAENSNNSPKIRKFWKFLKKKVFFEALISYLYRIVSRKKPAYRIDTVSSRKKAYHPGVILSHPKLSRDSYSQAIYTLCHFKSYLWKVCLLCSAENIS